jgi:hypothetical protein
VRKLVLSFLFCLPRCTCARHGRVPVSRKGCGLALRSGEVIVPVSSFKTPRWRRWMIAATAIALVYSVIGATRDGSPGRQLSTATAAR